MAVPLLASPLVASPLLPRPFLLHPGGDLVYIWFMTEEQPIDYEAARARFPWIGLGTDDDVDLSGRYREIMAQARIDREAMEAIDSIRQSA